MKLKLTLMSALFLAGCMNEFVNHSYATEEAAVDGMGRVKVAISGSDQVEGKGKVVRGNPYHLVILYFPAGNERICMQEVAIQQTLGELEYRSSDQNCGKPYTSKSAPLGTRFFSVDGVRIKVGEDVSISFELTNPDSGWSQSFSFDLEYFRIEKKTLPVMDAIRSV